MKKLILLLALIAPAGLYGQQIDSLTIASTDSVSAAMGRPTVAAFVLPDLSGSTVVDSARIQVKIVGGIWVDYYENSVLVKLRKLESYVLRNFPFDSLRFVADSAQTGAKQIHFVLR